MPKRIDPKIKNKIIKEYEKGITSQVLSDKYNVSMRTIQLYAKNAGLTQKNKKKEIQLSESSKSSESSEAEVVESSESSESESSESEESEDILEPLEMSDEQIIFNDKTLKETIKKELKTHSIEKQPVTIPQKQSNIIYLPEIDLKKTRTESVKPFVPVNNEEAYFKRLKEKYLK